MTSSNASSDNKMATSEISMVNPVRESLPYSESEVS